MIEIKSRNCPDMIRMLIEIIYDRISKCSRCLQSSQISIIQIWIKLINLKVGNFRWSKFDIENFRRVWGVDRNSYWSKLCLSKFWGIVRKFRLSKLWCKIFGRASRAWSNFELIEISRKLRNKRNTIIWMIENKDFLNSWIDDFR